jgi:opacity protein-like surface antigen
MKRFGPILLTLVVLILAGSTTPASAQTQSQATSGIGWRGWGVRAGVSLDPDQVFGGVHFDLGEFAKDVRFRPTIELGFGDDVTLLQALAEVHYVFSKVQVWKPYVGGGLGLAYANVDDVDNGLGDDDDSDTEFSLAPLGGVETKLRSGTVFHLELKLGFGDNDPDAKFSAGWSF